MRAKRVLAAMVLMLPLGVTAANGQGKKEEAPLPAPGEAPQPKKAAPTPAAPEYPDWKELDDVLYKAAARGTRLYGEGQHHAAYEHFDATLRAVLVSLDKFQKDNKGEEFKELGALIKRVIRAREQAADRRISSSERAFVLRGAINDIRNEPFREGRWRTKTPLWDRMGRTVFIDVINNVVPAAAQNAQSGLFVTNPGGTNPWLTALLLNAFDTGTLTIPLGPGQLWDTTSFSRAFARQLSSSLRNRAVPEPEIIEFLKLFKGLELTYTDSSVDND